MFGDDKENFYQKMLDEYEENWTLNNVLIL